MITAVGPNPTKLRALVIPPEVLQKAWPPLARPYRGLQAFGPDDEAYFFGRERFVDDLLRNVQQNTLSLVFGASGSGKSSVVLAGLLPKVLKIDWEAVVFRPGDPRFAGRGPLYVLAYEIAPLLNPRALPEDHLRIAEEWNERLGKKSFVHS